MNRLKLMDFVLYVKGRERYLIMFDDDHASRIAAIEHITQMAFDDELSLTPTDAAVMHDGVCKLVEAQ